MGGARWRSSAVVSALPSRARRGEGLALPPTARRVRHSRPGQGTGSAQRFPPCGSCYHTRTGRRRSEFSERITALPILLSVLGRENQVPATRRGRPRLRSASSAQAADVRSEIAVNARSFALFSLLRASPSLLWQGGCLPLRALSRSSERPEDLSPARRRPLRPCAARTVAAGRARPSLTWLAYAPDARDTRSSRWFSATGTGSAADRFAGARRRSIAARSRRGRLGAARSAWAPARTGAGRRRMQAARPGPATTPWTRAGSRRHASPRRSSFLQPRASRPCWTPVLRPYALATGSPAPL